MTSPQRRKGNGFEIEIVNYLRSHGHPFAERAYGAGRPADVGDINGLVGWCIEAKNHKSMDLAGWANEAAAEATNARCSWWAVIAKRRGKPVADAYVIHTLSQFAQMLADDETERLRAVEAAAQRVVGEWLERGDNGCSVNLQHELVAALEACINARAA